MESPNLPIPRKPPQNVANLLHDQSNQNLKDYRFSSGRALLHGHGSWQNQVAILSTRIPMTPKDKWISQTRPKVVAS